MRRNKPKVDYSVFYQPYDASHPVARAIATGSHWFHAWRFQYCLFGSRLARKSGIAPDRIEALDRGAAITPAEIEALATVYGVQPSDIIASLPGDHTLKG